MAMEAATGLRGGVPLRERMLAIGDAIRTDIAGAAAFGIDSLFIGQGIHRDEVMRSGRLDADAVASLLSTQHTHPVAPWSV